MRGSKTEMTIEPAVADEKSLALITARTLRDLMSSRGKHVAELDDAIKAAEGDAAPAAETNEYDDD